MLKNGSAEPGASVNVAPGKEKSLCPVLRGEGGEGALLQLKGRCMG